MAPTRTRPGMSQLLLSVGPRSNCSSFSGSFPMCNAGSPSTRSGDSTGLGLFLTQAAREVDAEVPRLIVSVALPDPRLRLRCRLELLLLPTEALRLLCRCDLTLDCVDAARTCSSLHGCLRAKRPLAAACSRIAALRRISTVSFRARSASNPTSPTSNTDIASCNSCSVTSMC